MKLEIKNGTNSLLKYYPPSVLLIKFFCIDGTNGKKFSYFYFISFTNPLMLKLYTWILYIESLHYVRNFLWQSGHIQRGNGSNSNLSYGSLLALDKIFNDSMSTPCCLPCFKFQIYFFICCISFSLSISLLVLYFISFLCRLFSFACSWPFKLFNNSIWIHIL